MKTNARKPDFLSSMLKDTTAALFYVESLSDLASLESILTASEICSIKQLHLKLSARAELLNAIEKS